MKFSEMVDQARALLQRTGKLTYRVLKREFALDDEALEDLKEQFIAAEEVAVDQDGKVLVWIGAGGNGESGHRSPYPSPQHRTSSPQAATRRRIWLNAS